MTRHPKNKLRAKPLRSLYIWHRYLGLAAASFVIILAATGLALNHTEQLGLDSNYVKSGALLNWYGIQAPENITSYEVDTHTVSAVGEYIYWDTTRIPQTSSSLIGAVHYADLIVVGIEGQLLLFTLDGQLVEQLGGAAGVPAGMQALGVTPDNKLAIHAAHGFYQTDEDFLEWQETDHLDASWNRPARPSEDLRLALQSAYRGSGLSLERIMLDLHSGRILGNRGVYLVDAAAVLFLLLACSGVGLWSRRRASARAHQRHIKERNRNKES
jgi:hypothetical protein